MYFILRERGSCNSARLKSGQLAQIGRVGRGLAVAAAALGLAAIGAPSGLAQQAQPAPTCDPYKDYSCLDSYLGTGVLERFFNYYVLEWGKGTAPVDPNAPPARIEGWPRTPGTIPPLAYLEWPTGATTSIGVTRANSIDSPLMAAISNTDEGKWLIDNHIQIYGWVNPGFNLSTNDRGKGANNPVAYTYSSNTVVLDQAVLYIERLPDTVQTDHIDWGFRLSGLYGIDQRYTTSYGLASWQFNKQNLENGYDFPMIYAEIYDPFIMSGFMLRFGRYVSIPDIEAQLAPNNPTYTHSFTYGYDNYTNTGMVGSLQVTPKLMVQLGVTDGTETPLWNNGVKLANLYVLDHGPGSDPLYPGTTMLKDPGNQLTGTFCVRYAWNDGWDTFYPCMDGINQGNWGYNNLQWHGFTYYHRFNDEWHIDFESYYLSENGVPNLRNNLANTIFTEGGTPFSPQYTPRNPPNLAYCANTTQLKCNVYSVGVLTYINYTPDPLNNWTVRLEFYDDPQGWRTATATTYFDTSLSWQHWLSPQIELRPEISYWQSFNAPAFNSNPSEGIPGNKYNMVEFSSDLIIHF